MVGIVVNYDVVGIPVPVIAKGEIGGGDAPIKIVEPETVRSAPRKMPDMTAAEATVKVAMFKRTIEMVVDVVAAGVMADPLVAVNVGDIGMAVFIGIIARRRRRLPATRLPALGLSSARLSTLRLSARAAA